MEYWQNIWDGKVICGGRPEPGRPTFVLQSDMHLQDSIVLSHRRPLTLINLSPNAFVKATVNLTPKGKVEIATAEFRNSPAQ